MLRMVKFFRPHRLIIDVDVAVFDTHALPAHGDKTFSNAPIFKFKRDNVSRLQRAQAELPRNLLNKKDISILDCGIHGGPGASRS